MSDIKGRGVVLKDGQTLKDLYEERVPLYEKYADITATFKGCLESHDFIGFFED